MSKITAMYIRLSMEDEDVSLNRKEESNSISSQRELLKAYIENHSELKDTKVQEYCDDGFTGTKFERPGYMKLMEDIRAEKISCIVVKDLSRLGRDSLSKIQFIFTYSLFLMSNSNPSFADCASFLRVLPFFRKLIRGDAILLRFTT